VTAASYIPDGVENVERIVELRLLWVVLDGEETCVAEVQPGNKPQTEDSVAGRTLVDVQHQTRVKELCTITTIQHLHIDLICFNLFKAKTWP